MVLWVWPQADHYWAHFLIILSSNWVQRYYYKVTYLFLAKHYFLILSPHASPQPCANLTIIIHLFQFALTRPPSLLCSLSHYKREITNFGVDLLSTWVSSILNPFLECKNVQFCLLLSNINLSSHLWAIKRL